MAGVDQNHLLMVTQSSRHFGKDNLVECNWTTTTKVESNSSILFTLGPELSIKKLYWNYIFDQMIRFHVNSGNKSGKFWNPE